MITVPVFAFALIASVSADPMRLRELVCRGKPGIDLKITQRPSPADPRLVRMTLRYDRPTVQPGANYENLAPGSCTWNPNAFSGFPPEPGTVQFDVTPEMQEWFASRTRQLDTTYLAAAFFPDTISVRRYLARSDLYWKFFVDDHTTISTSFGAFRNPTLRPNYVMITGPLQQQGSVATRSASGASKTAATARLSKLTFRGVDRRMDGFTVRFTARPGASATVNYSTSAPANTPSGWYFAGAGLQGSGAVSRGGQTAEVSVTRRGSVNSDYSGSTRLPTQRGTNYHFIITVQGASGPVEQYVGRVFSMRIDVSPTVTEFVVTKKPFEQSVQNEMQLFCESSGVFRLCDGKNVPGRIGILVWARPNFGPRDANPTSWTVMPGKNSGVGKLVIDTRTLRLDRTMQPFTIRSLEGDIEFEAHGQVHIKRY